ncbi:hypothetical protein D3C73_103050 [compost metagenome]
MSTTDVFTLVIDGCSDMDRAKITVATPDGKGLVRLIGPGHGPHRVRFVENPDGTTTAIGRSGKQTASIDIPPTAELS